MNLRFYILGVPKAFDYYPRLDNNQYDYLATYYVQRVKERERLSIHRKSDGRVMYVYSKYQLVNCDGRGESFLGLALEFSAKQGCCLNVCLLYKVFETVYGFILEDGDIIKENNRQEVQFQKPSFEAYGCELLENIEFQLIENINDEENFKETDFIPIDKTFTNNKPSEYKSIPLKDDNTEFVNKKVVEYLREYNYVYISRDYTDFPPPPTMADSCYYQYKNDLTDIREKLTDWAFNKDKAKEEESDIEERKKIISSRIKDFKELRHPTTVDERDYNNTKESYNTCLKQCETLLAEIKRDGEVAPPETIDDSSDDTSPNKKGISTGPDMRVSGKLLKFIRPLYECLNTKITRLVSGTVLLILVLCLIFIPNRRDTQEPIDQKTVPVDTISEIRNQIMNLIATLKYEDAESIYITKRGSCDLSKEGNDLYCSWCQSLIQNKDWDKAWLKIEDISDESSKLQMQDLVIKGCTKHYQDKVQNATQENANKLKVELSNLQVPIKNKDNLMNVLDEKLRPKDPTPPVSPSNSMVEFKLQSLCHAVNRDKISAHNTTNGRHNYVQNGDTYVIVISEEYQHFSMQIEKTIDGNTVKGFSLPPKNYQEIFAYDKQLLDVFIEKGYLCVVAEGLYNSSTEVKEAELVFKPKTTNKRYKFIFQKQ